MCADLIVVRSIRRNDLPQVRLAEDQHPVQALAAHGATQTLHIRILPRRSRRNRSVADTHGPHPRRKDMSVGTALDAARSDEENGGGDDSGASGGGSRGKPAKEGALAVLQSLCSREFSSASTSSSPGRPGSASAWD